MDEARSKRSMDVLQYCLLLKDLGQILNFDHNRSLSCDIMAHVCPDLILLLQVHLLHLTPRYTP